MPFIEAPCNCYSAHNELESLLVQYWFEHSSRIPREKHQFVPERARLEHEEQKREGVQVSPFARTSATIRRRRTPWRGTRWKCNCPFRPKREYHGDRCSTSIPPEEVKQGGFAIGIRLATQWSTDGRHHFDGAQHADGAKAAHKCRSVGFPHSCEHLARVEGCHTHHVKEAHDSQERYKAKGRSCVPCHHGHPDEPAVRKSSFRFSTEVELEIVENGLGHVTLRSLRTARSATSRTNTSDG